MTPHDIAAIATSVRCLTMDAVEKAKSGHPGLPMGLAELGAVAAAAARSGRTLRVFENFMHYPPHRLARRLLAEGAIGQPTFGRPRTEVSGELVQGHPGKEDHR